jgi:hypothetical protein
MTDREKISKAFKELRKLGYFARMNFWCCQSCGCAAVPESYFNKFVFYHSQDNESIVDGNIGEHGMYMTHGEGGDGHQIVSILNKHELKATWDGDNDTRIFVQHKA